MSVIQQFTIDEVTKTVKIDLDKVYTVALVPSPSTSTMNVYYNSTSGQKKQHISFGYMPTPFSVDVFDGNPPQSTLRTAGQKKMKVTIGE